MKTHRIYWIITITIFIGLLVPTLVQDGMFLDGVTYSAISKNMSNGHGDFWNPHYTQTMYVNFYEHPSMVFIIQSFCFRILGDGLYTERIFCLLTAILTALGIVLCWRLFNNKNESGNYAWIPIILWITIPLVSWSFMNNLLENTLGVFTIFSVYFILKSLIKSKIKYLLLGSIFLVMAFLSKGLVGLFPFI
ncbi:ArnT family glycosyltransferase, partial [Bacteroidota bacterium]